MALFDDFPKIYIDSLDSLIEIILHEAKKGDVKKYVVPTNLDIIRHFYTNPAARNAFKHAWLFTADGFPLVLFSKQFFGYKIRQKITGVELTFKLIETVAKRNLNIRMYFLGGSTNSKEKIIRRFGQIYSNLKKNFVGGSLAYFDVYKDKSAVKAEVEKINKARPDIVFIGIGSPKQELFLYNNRNELKYGVAICVGQTIHILAGDVKLPPKWTESLGLVFLYRMFTKKGGLRILVRVLKDVLFLLKYILKAFLKSK